MPYRVLIVDDQKAFSRLLRSALETIEQNLVVSEAPSGEEGILVASRIEIDLLVADFRLPGINGVELIKKFRIINPKGKVIMISGVSDPRLFKQITEAAPDAFFPKPVPMGDFLEAVEDCLGTRSERTIFRQTLVSPSNSTGEENKPPPPAPTEPPGWGNPGNRMDLGDLLQNLRKNLSAQAVLLLTDTGQLVAEAGQMADTSNKPALISALMGLFNATKKTASLINRAESHLHLFGDWVSPGSIRLAASRRTGDELDGIFLPIDPTYALLLMGKGLTDTRTLSARVDLLFAARPDLLEALSRTVPGPAFAESSPGSARSQNVNIPLDVPLDVPLEHAPAELKSVSTIDESFPRTEDLPGDFLNIFNQTDRSAKINDANSFWDSAVEKGTTFVEPDKLTYEQASRLGLTPDSAS